MNNTIIEQDESWMQRLWDWDNNNNNNNNNNNSIHKYIFSKNGNLPKNRDRLLNLKTLDIAFNGLEILPKEIGNLVKLTQLDISGNEIKILPKEIGNLVKLTKVWFHCNKLKKLSKSFCNLKQLNILFLSDNQLVSLPSNIINLKDLTRLDLKNNQQLILTRKQKEWIKELINSGCKIRMDDDLLERKYLIEKPISEMNDEEFVYDMDYTTSLCDDVCSENDAYILEKYDIDYIYHMTHYKNLKDILSKGLLSHNNKLVKVHIDNSEVNDKRNKLLPIKNKNLHSYVPFYFNPKNAMLYVNKDIQEDIIILAFNKNLLLKEKTIFTDGNATSDITNFFNDINNLDKLNWDCINTNYWIDFEDGKRERMSEILIPKKVKIKHLQKIYCYNIDTKKYILNLNDELDVKVNKKIYF